MEGIHCNLTLLFSLVQAVHCTELGATLISPSVGRIMDWNKAETGRDYTAPEDPGVQSVQSTYNDYKKFGYKTEIMGASFRDKGEIIELAGCDLLGELQESSNLVDRNLSQEETSKMDIEHIEITKKRFVGCLMKMR